MKKTSVFFLLAIICFFSSLNFAEDYTVTETGNTSTPKQSRWYFGGNIGANVWNDYMLISVEPMLGYNFSSKFSSGIKAHYSFIKENYKNRDNFTYHNFGGSLFMRYSPVPQGYLHAEFAFTNYEHHTYNQISQRYESERLWVPFVLLGAGYRQPIGSNATAYAEILFDILQDKNSPFKKWEPIVHVGVAVGF
ncbi:MAG TPA: hypothetical protein PK073_12640 [Ignavibacteriaceae bacterium]|jgi:hypothetical protein|nr:MAG: hypothetical protein BWY38_01754 [Ignavibacteria bacterium ADurb.Bin266]OQY70038.1 MAG: hypothetical protein B6D44_16445 [Ignavibacteriales bacterium UTCHB2]HQF43750.1 hypothetical protein [Ignavibacteriaceae bacterium]HQI40545.1 hypothetical protein [Ignavibacteriaceae bacterium]HQJ47389.1 hypothetical protein [Ignavibacteriaceae bacterium]